MPGCKVATIHLESCDSSAMDRAIPMVFNASEKGAELVVLPELFFLESRKGPIDQLLAASSKAVDALTLVAREAGCLIASSIYLKENDKVSHAGIIVDKNGIVHTQKQLQKSALNPENLEYDSKFTGLDTKFGRVGIIVGEDNIYPESYRLAALDGCHLVLAPLEFHEKWEVDTGLLERASENRLCVVAASRPNPFGTSAIYDLDSDFTILTPWQQRSFDGNISLAKPQFSQTADCALIRRVNLPGACNKVVSHRTNLLDDRPWRAAASSGENNHD